MRVGVPLALALARVDARRQRQHGDLQEELPSHERVHHHSLRAARRNRRWGHAGRRRDRVLQRPAQLRLRIRAHQFFCVTE